MSSVFHKLFGAILPKSEDQKYAEAYRRAIQEEAKLGGKLFGPTPKGHRREFFCLDRRTWVWHEEWEENGRTNTVTTRYDVTPTGIYKAQDNQPYQPISDEEKKNLIHAAEEYQKQVNEALEPILKRS